MGEYNDLQLIELAKNDNECFESMLNKYLKKYHNFAYKYSYKYNEEIDDLKQILSMGFYEAIKDFNKNKINSDKFIPEKFIVHIMKRELIDYIKGQYRQKRRISKECISIDSPTKTYKSESDNLSILEVLSNSIDIERDYILKEKAHEIRKDILKGLSKNEHEILKLRLDGYTQTDISKIMNISTKQTDNALTRAKGKIKKRGLSGELDYKKYLI